MKLASKTVANLVLPAGKKDRIWFDDTLKGFGYRLRVGAGGQIRGSWVVQYRHGGAHRRYRIADAAVLGADQARAEARKLLARLALGSDPALERGDRRGKDQLTLRSIIDEFLAAKTTAVRQSTMRSLERYLRGGYFRPLLGTPVDRIRRRDIAARLTVIARESGAPSAGLARGALIQCLAWAMRAGLTETNPAIDTPAPAAARPRERVLDNDELAAVWRASGDDDYGRIVRLLILCGSRRAEVGGLAWSELDLDSGIWILPATRSKNGRSHALPIMPMMRAILDQVPRRATRDQLFGARGAGGYADWTMGKRGIDQRSGVTDWTLHDLRRTAATRMADIGIAPHIIEEILNHQSGHRRGVAGVYNRSRYEREVRAVLAVWHDHVRAIAAGGARKVLPWPQTTP
jgi:integrase